MSDAQKSKKDAAADARDAVATVAPAPRFLGDGYPPVPVVPADPDPAPENSGALVPLEVPDPVKDGEDGADASGRPSPG